MSWFVFRLRHGLFETLYCFTNSASQFRKLTGTKNNQNDDKIIIWCVD